MNDIINVAAGRVLADLVFKNGKIVDVFSGELIEGDLAIYKDKIVGIGSYSGKQEIDLNGKIVCPSFVDAHLHIESSMVLPNQYAEVALLTGTTTFICDPHEIVNVCGTKGLKMMLKNSKDLPCDFKFVLPSCVPATPFETNGCNLNAKKTARLLRNKNIFGLGEMMNYVGIVENDKEVIAKVKAAKNLNKSIDGHAPMLKGNDLNAYVCAGIRTEHEAETKEELEEKVRKGMYVLLRHGSASRAVDNLIEFVKPHMIRRLCFCSDDKNAGEIKTIGGINKNIKVAIEKGMDPIDAITIASLNACECYGLKEKGAIAPGYFANLTIIDNFENFDILDVYYKGKQIVSNKKLCVNIPNEAKAVVKNKIKFDEIPPEKLQIKLSSDEATVIGLNPNSLLTEKLVLKVNVENGVYLNTQGINKLIVVERYGKTNNVGLGLVTGFNLKNGAMAQSISHDSHNIVCIGDNDADMLLACETLKELNGGVVVVSAGKVISKLRLEVGGLMTTAPLDFVLDQYNEINKSIHKLGVSKEINGIIQLSFLALPVIPKLKLTDKGLFNVEKFKFINLDPKLNS